MSHADDLEHIVALARGGPRRVATPEGARLFGQPIGSIIVPDVYNAVVRKHGAKKASEHSESGNVGGASGRRVSGSPQAGAAGGAGGRRPPPRTSPGAAGDKPGDIPGDKEGNRQRALSARRGGADGGREFRGNRVSAADFDAPYEPAKPDRGKADVPARSTPFERRIVNRSGNTIDIDDASDKDLQEHLEKLGSGMTARGSGVAGAPTVRKELKRRQKIDAANAAPDKTDGESTEPPTRTPGRSPRPPEAGKVPPAKASTAKTPEELGLRERNGYNGGKSYSVMGTSGKSPNGSPLEVTEKKPSYADGDGEGWWVQTSAGIAMPGGPYPSAEAAVNAAKNDKVDTSHRTPGIGPDGEARPFNATERANIRAENRASRNRARESVQNRNAAAAPKPEREKTKIPPRFGDKIQVLPDSRTAAVGDDGKLKPGIYSKKGGSAHFEVHEDGTATYYNSRGEAKDITAAAAKRNFDAGMNSVQLDAPKARRSGGKLAGDAPAAESSGRINVDGGKPDRRQQRISQALMEERTQVSDKATDKQLSGTELDSASRSIKLAADFQGPASKNSLDLADRVVAQRQAALDTHAAARPTGRTGDASLAWERVNKQLMQKLRDDKAARDRIAEKLAKRPLA